MPKEVKFMDYVYFDAQRLEKISCNVYFFSTHVVPKYAIKDGAAWRISTPAHYNIKKVKVLVNSFDEIVKIRVDAPHPNASLFDGNFCLPNSVYGLYLSYTTYQFLLKMIERWNIDSCYFIPDDFKYKNKKGNILKRLYRRK